MEALRSEIKKFLGIKDYWDVSVPVILEEVREDGFTRKLVSYATSDGDTVYAFLFEPHAVQATAAVVALHQHNSEWVIGKSEIAGLAGDPLQAFGPALARAGVVVFAPDAIGFESRCGSPGYGAALGPDISRAYGTADGWLQYYNHAMHRLVRGELLMTKILRDVASAVTVSQGFTSAERCGIVGHSYGGNVVLFAAALDARIDFACSSGAACSFRHKLAHGTALEMALVIPGFASRFDFDDLIRCVAPRNLLVVSSDDDPYAADATDLVANAKPAFQALGAEENLSHIRVGRSHALDSRRFSAIVEWLVGQSSHTV
jgi:dienelactone hydrolase